MDPKAEEAVQTPATVLMVVGVLILLFHLFYAVWTGLGLLSGCMGVGVQGMAIAGGEGSVAAAGFGMWGIVMSTIALILYLVIAAAGAYVAKGAAGMKNLQGLDGSKKAALIAGIGPLLGLVIGAVLSVMSFGCCGFVLGVIPQIIMVAVSVGGAFFAHSTLGDDAVASAFQD